MKYFILFYFLIHKIYSQKISLNNKSSHFIDEFNRTVIFHGVNVVVKIPPYIPKTDKFDPFFSLTNKDILFMKKFGFNLVRLGIIWEAVERGPGVYDYEYLDKMTEIIDNLGKNGIMVIVDAHQDLFSRTLCGEGVPTFYAKDLIISKDCNDNFVSKLYKFIGFCINWKDLKTLNETTKEFTNPPREIQYDSDGLPNIEDCKKRSFVEMHLIPEVSSIYSEFYKNTNNIIDKFIEFWKVLIKRFKENPYIIAFDIWNEPWSGEFHTSIWGGYPGAADSKYLLPFYRKVDQELRKVDKDYVLIFSPSLTDNIPLYGGFYFTGFSETPGGDENKSKQIISEHLYCLQSDTTFMNANTHPTHFNHKCKRFFQYKLNKFKNLAKKLGVVPFIGEFGACRDNLACFNEISNFANICDQLLMSWAYWNYKPYGDHTTACDNDEGIFNSDGKIQQHKMKALVRPYIQRFQGLPIQNKYEPQSKLLISRFRLNLDITQGSEVYFNEKMTFPDGFKYIIIPYEQNKLKAEDKNIFDKIALKIEKMKYKLIFTVSKKNQNEIISNNYTILFILTKKITKDLRYVNKQLLLDQQGKIMNPNDTIETKIEDLEISSEYGNIVEISTTNNHILKEMKNFFVTIQSITKPEKVKKSSCNIGEKCFIKAVFSDIIKVRIFFRNVQSRRKIKVFKMNFHNALKNFIRILIK